ncbi:MAG: sigma-54-dependent Fis family transcriptional regulator [Deltaproteobacteria bacterium]|nr:sigma-54-dependent Fis family transcriptional regulator [Deltaproteobacteria bacterium]
MKPLILIVDDEVENLKSLERIFSLEAYGCLTAGSAHEALQYLKTNTVALAFIDIRMPGVDGMTLLAKIKNQFPKTDVVMMTAFGTIETAVCAMKLGACDFITKPLSRSTLMQVLEKTVERLRTLHSSTIPAYNLEKPQPNSKWERILGSGQTMQDLLKTVDNIAASAASVLIEGETGVGKEVLANLLVEKSARFQRPYLKINCAALPETLLESELFGHERGAFTGAVKLKKGFFEEAHMGTLLLDEISEIPLSLQAKLLRVTQSGEFCRLGRSHVQKSDVRLISAPNKNLKSCVHEGHFREDLYYRIHVIRLYIPPLRERPEDIPSILDFFLSDITCRLKKNITHITDSALQTLIHYTWPGNIRELSHTLERAILLTPRKVLTEDDFMSHLAQESSSQNNSDLSLESNYQELIDKALKLSTGNRSKAAKLLGIHERTLYRKLKK